MALPDSPQCPRCHETMQSGFLAFTSRMNWVDQLGTFDALIFKGETIAGVTDVALRTAHLKGWRCRRCQLMIVDYGAGVF